MKTCFIISPIGSKESNIRKNADKLFDFILKPACDKAGFKPHRIDHINHIDKIDSKIIDYLETSDLVIADTSTQNANCFYEIGYRTALNKPIILLKKEDEALPFDVASIRCISYGFDVETSSIVIDEIVKTINAINFHPTTHDNLHEKQITNNDIYQAVLGLKDRIDEIPRKFNSETIDILSSKISNKSDDPTENLMNSFFAFCTQANEEDVKKISQNLSRIKFE